MIHHRTPAFDQILAQVLTRLKDIFKTTQPVFILSSTGSGGMESLLVNTMSPSDKVLVIDSGKFGERWAEMAKVYGAAVETIKIAWGESVSPALIDNLLQKQSDIKLVLCQACETSTGVVHPIKEIGEVIKKYPGTLFLVDGITALGAMPLPMDEWHIDGLVGGSQKAFMLPTGLSLFSFSQKAWDKIPHATCPRFYFDVRKELKANQSGETFFSSNVTYIRALNVVMDLIFEKGLENLFAQIARRAQFTRHFGTELGLQLFAKNPSNSLTAFLVNADVDSQKVRLDLEKKHGITIMGGQDQAKGKIIRIGHMGYIDDVLLLQTMLSLYDVLKEHTREFLPPKNQFQNSMQNWLKNNPDN